MNMQQPSGAAPVRAPAQGDMATHLQASQMAHAAATRASVAKVLGQGSPGMGMAQRPTPAPAMAPPAAPGGAPPATGANFKQHVISMAKTNHGITASVPHVHAAIDAATAAGHFHPDQGAALKAHNGPLMGAPGANTIATLSSTLGHMGQQGGMS